MGLQVWLPLTKDLRQQGSSNVTVTNNGATYESNGKLGGCYNLTNGPINITNLPNPTSISVAFWFKRTANTNTRQFMFTAWNGVTCELTTDGKPTFAVYRNSYPTITGPTAITTSTGWIHYCGTFSPIEGMKMYLNGELVASNTNTTAISWSTTTGQIGKYSSYASMSAQMDDFRIYDHCLSPMEVKELSKGLVLHYPLNRDGCGQENLISNTDFGGVSKKYTVTSGTEGGFTYTPTETIMANTEYIVSCRLRGNANMNLYKICTGGNEALNWVNRNQLSTTEYRPFSIIFTYPSSKTLNQIYICTRYGTSNTSTGDWFEIEPCSLKLERGSIATPWCPNSSDALATTMGLNSTTEYDCSGFCNNGTRTGTFSWISDTPKYVVSTKLTTGSKITSSTGMMTTANPTFTCNFWVKMPSATYTTWADIITFSGSAIIRMETSNTAGTSLSWYNYPIGTSSGIGTNGAVNNTDWNMFTLTCDGTNWKTYKNGVLVSTVAISGTAWTPNGTVSIGDNGMYAQLSDVRIYATALSAEDVKSLYQNEAFIDSSGNIYGQIR